MTNFLDFNIGNAITILGGIVATAMVWQKLKDRLDMTTEATVKNSKDLDDILKLALNTSVQQHERRIQVLEDAIKTMSISLESMRNDLTWIKQLLQRQEDSHR